ncbi:hypothetical protein [Rubrobacter calidifluminis]|uniref:hypothetical protein n=1 Tax=Rubrobacter calidifluminis TaxID=1392640 RepID=UPI00236131FE|nr:hypothetical protein [Rubrobacter calidifluminis]
MPQLPARTDPALPAIFTNVLNPFVVFSVLYALVAVEAGAPRFVAAELAAAGLVAGFVLALRRGSRVGDFWLSSRAERLLPAVVLLAAFVGLLVVLHLFGAPGELSGTTLSMGVAATVAAGITLFWKISAHSAVAGHAAAAGLLLLGAGGLPFLLVLPLVLWARVSAGAHTPSQALAGAGLGAVCAGLFLAG